jgi:hypothetical protein
MQQNLSVMRIISDKNVIWDAENRILLTHDIKIKNLFGPYQRLREATFFPF